MSTFNKWIHAKERGGLVRLPDMKDIGGWKFIPFLFNPSTYTEDDTQNYKRTTVPMWPDQLTQYIGGAGATLKFEIVLEKERIVEFFRYRDINALLNTSAGSGNESARERKFFSGSTDSLSAVVQFPMTVDEYIAEIETLKAPKQGHDAGDFFAGSPPRVMVIFGKFYKIGFIQKTTIMYEEFFSSGETRSAQIQVSMILAYGRMNYYRRISKGVGSTASNRR